ncbi:MAG TPA: hypothetical protein VFO52_09670 [Longimicrobiales bacterium]|nr:hypothetical protein [Longimicrobiales bacterium]
MNEWLRARWPFRSRILKAVFVASVTIMLVSALVGLTYALLEREFGPRSLMALTVGLGAVLIAVTVLVVEVLTRKFHPETALFLWSDVDQLRALARSAPDPETRSWALSLSDRIAVVLPGRKKVG